MNATKNYNIKILLVGNLLKSIYSLLMRDIIKTSVKRKKRKGNTIEYCTLLVGTFMHLMEVKIGTIGISMSVVIKVSALTCALYYLLYMMTFNSLF